MRDPDRLHESEAEQLSRGRPGEEQDDYGYTFTNARRRSNSSTHGHAINDFKTKFETVEPEVVFEEEYHGAKADMESETMSLDKTDSTDSTSAVSVDEEDHTKKV